MSFKLPYFLLCAGMASKGKNKFAKAAHVARKGKAATESSGSLPKRARRAEEIIMLPSPPPPPATEELAPTQLESSSRGTPSLTLVQIEPS